MDSRNWVLIHLCTNFKYIYVSSSNYIVFSHTWRLRPDHFLTIVSLFQVSSPVSCSIKGLITGRGCKDKTPLQILVNRSFKIAAGFYLLHLSPLHFMWVEKLNWRVYLTFSYRKYISQTCVVSVVCVETIRMKRLLKRISNALENVVHSTLKWQLLLFCSMRSLHSVWISLWTFQDLNSLCSLSGRW